MNCYKTLISHVMLVGYPPILSLHTGSLAKQLNHQEVFSPGSNPTTLCLSIPAFQSGGGGEGEGDNAVMFAFVKMFEVFGQRVIRDKRVFNLSALHFIITADYFLSRCHTALKDQRPPKYLLLLFNWDDPIWKFSLVSSAAFLENLKQLDADFISFLIALSWGRTLKGTDIYPCQYFSRSSI